MRSKPPSPSRTCRPSPRRSAAPPLGCHLHPWRPTASSTSRCPPSFWRSPPQSNSNCRDRPQRANRCGPRRSRQLRQLPDRRAGRLQRRCLHRWPSRRRQQHEPLRLLCRGQHQLLRYAQSSASLSGRASVAVPRPMSSTVWCMSARYRRRHRRLRRRGNTNCSERPRSANRCGPGSPRHQAPAPLARARRSSTVSPTSRAPARSTLSTCPARPIAGQRPRSARNCGQHRSPRTAAPYPPRRPSTTARSTSQRRATRG